MPTTLVDLVILMAAVAGSGSMVAVGMWLYYRIKRLEGENRTLAQLTDHFEGLQDRLGEVHDEVGELHERVDFTERMLARGSEKKQEPPAG